MAYELWTIKEQQDLGVFCWNYYRRPAAALADRRTSFRESTIISKVSDRIKSGDTVQVLDVCCGNAILANSMLKSLGNNAKFVDYWCVDSDHECIKSINENLENFNGFADFHCEIRDVTSQLGFEGLPKEFDLIVLINALHEVPPSDFPDLFAALNSRLSKEKGILCLVDMEELPLRQAESCAITWLGHEVSDMLTSGGFSPKVATFSKGDNEEPINVFEVNVSAIEQVDREALRQVIKHLLDVKMQSAIEVKGKAPFVGDRELDRMQTWFVASGTISRCAEELSILDV